MDQHTRDNWRKIKQALEEAGKTDSFFYRRAVAIGLYDLYQNFVELARADAISELDLRVFELDLLDVLGYGINFDTDSKDNSEFKDSMIYSYVPEKGFHYAGEVEGFSAKEIAAIKNRTLEGIDKLKLKQLSQVAISACLDGRELSSRDFFKKIRI